VPITLVKDSGTTGNFEISAAGQLVFTKTGGDFYPLYTEELMGAMLAKVEKAFNKQTAPATQAATGAVAESSSEYSNVEAPPRGWFCPAKHLLASMGQQAEGVSQRRFARPEGLKHWLSSHGLIGEELDRCYGARQWQE